MDVEEARRRVLSADPLLVRGIEGSFAIVARDGITVRLARSMDRPMRYFLAKRQEGPALFVADRMDTLRDALDSAKGSADQFHPSYTRMVPAHHVVELQLVGCPDPDPGTRGSSRPRATRCPTDLDEIGQRYIGALARRGHAVAAGASTPSTQRAPIGVAFSGGIDSGAVFLVDLSRDAAARHGAHAAQGVHAEPRRRARCRAGPRRSSPSLDLSIFLEEIDGAPGRPRRRRDAARARRLQAARRAVRGHGAAALPRHPRALSRTGGTSSTATAATRT